MYKEHLTNVWMSHPLLWTRNLWTFWCKTIFNFYIFDTAPKSYCTNKKCTFVATLFFLVHGTQHCENGPIVWLAILNDFRLLYGTFPCANEFAVTVCILIAHELDCAENLRCTELNLTCRSLSWNKIAHHVSRFPLGWALWPGGIGLVLSPPVGQYNWVRYESSQSNLQVSFPYMYTVKTRD